MYLEMEVVDSCKGPQAVVPHAEPGVVDLGRKAQRQQQRPCVHLLWGALEDPRDKQHVPILHWAHLHMTVLYSQKRTLV